MLPGQRGLCFEKLSFIKDIDFSKCSLVSDEGLSDFSETFKSLANLSTLQLVTKGCNVNDKGMESLSKRLKELINLSDLALSLDLFREIGRIRRLGHIFSIKKPYFFDGIELEVQYVA